MSEWDLIVVGAGIQGVATAAAAALAGASTMLIDRAALAEGPTGVSSALCRTYYTNPFLAEVARDAIDYIDQLDALTGLCGLRRTRAVPSPGNRHRRRAADMRNPHHGCSQHDTAGAERGRDPLP